MSDVFAGETFSMYAPTGKPSLTAQLRCNLPGATTLTVDFWFKSRVPSDAEADRYTAELTSGGLLFL